MAYLEGVMNRVLLFMGTVLLAIVSLAAPAHAVVELTGATPSTFSGPGETITFTYRLDEENITVNSMSLSGTNVPISGLTCTPAFPIDPFEVTNCTATYTTTASDVSDIRQYGGTYYLETIGGPRTGVVSSGAFFVSYVPPTPPQAIVTWDSGYLMAIGGPSGFLPNGGSVDIGTPVTFDFALPPGWTYASLPSGCNIVHDSGDTWQGTITETCHVSGSETIIVLHGIGSSELVVGEFGFFDIWTDGGVSPFTLTLDSGAVPAGMTFSDGHIAGIPSETGSFEFTVGATNEYGHSASQAFTLTVAEPSSPAPTITSISPNSGPAEGGTSVVITGTNFTDATDVAFGGTGSMSVTVNSDTQITAVTPAGTAGAVDVAVTTPAGTTTETGGFTYLAGTVPALSIDDVSRVETNSGSTFFLFNVQLDQPAPAGGVTFDVATADGTATAGDDYATLSITGVTIGPASFAAPITVQVYGDTVSESDETFFVNITNVTGATVADGQGVGTIQDDDTAAPTISSISPSSGAPGTMVTISGTGLTGANSVYFDGVVALNVTPVDDNTVLAEVPTHPGGVVDVEVYADAGLATAPDAFTVDSSSPTAHPVSATVDYGSSNNPITLNITGTPASSVAVGTAPANGTATASGMTISYTPDPGYAGLDSFTYTATNAGGTSSPATVTITVVDPVLQDFAFETDFNTPRTFNVANGGASHYFLSQAPSNGTAIVNADGSAIYSPNTGFSGTDEFQYDVGVYGNNAGTVTITVNQPTIAYAPTNPPAGTVGTVYSRSIGGGVSGGTAPYTYAHAAGTMVPGLTLATDGTLSGTPTTAGTFTFSVIATDSSTGTGPFSSPSADVSVMIAPAAPTITGISPNSGLAAGGTSVTITGTNFVAGATTVTFGSIPAASVIIDSATQITAVTPAGPAGSVDVSVTTPGGTVTEAGGFTYQAPTSPELSINDVTVNEGDGNAVFTITLSAPAGPGGVTFDLTTADGTAIAGDDYHSFNNFTTIPEGVDTYYHAVGLIDDAVEETNETLFLEVSNIVGASLAKARGMATIVDNDTSVPPTIAGISPDEGPEAGGTSVTITGSGLTGATDVTFGGTAASSFTVDSDTQISAVTPAGTAGAADVSVTTPVDTVTAADGFTYKALPVPPMVESLSVPAPVTYHAGQNLDFTVHFDENVVVTGTPRIGLAIGTATRYANYVSGSGTSALSFLHIANTGDQDLDGIAITGLDANGGTLRSAQGIDANLTLNNVGSTSGVLVDAVAPTAISSAVVGDTELDATSVGFEVTFSEQVNGVDPTDFVLTTTGSAEGTVEGIGTADGVTYYVNVTDISGVGSLRLDVQADGSIADLASNAMVAAYTSGTPWVRGGSADANLSDLVPSAGNLDPVFDPATIGYAVAVDNTIESITLTPTAAAAGATISVDGQAVASGSASQAIALTVGATAIAVVVTGEDGTTIQTYTVTVTRAASADATLSGLVPNEGTLNPAFDPATADYDVAVDNATDSIMLTPAAADANATITVDGQTVASGSASQMINLSVGATVIDVAVTAANGTTVQTYTVTVTRSASADATLSGLVPSEGALDPSFAPATFGYAVAVDNTVETIRLTPTVADVEATVTVDGTAVVSGSASEQIGLVVGETTIPVVVTAEDGTTTQTYTVTVVRAASADATLSSLVPSEGALDPTFDPATTSYDIDVDNATDSIMLTPTAAEANSMITVDGQAVTSGNASQQIALAVGATAIPVVITAEDGTTVQTYTVTVTRAASAEATLTSLAPSEGTLDPGFAPATTSYAVTVDHMVEAVTLTPTATDANATITVAGQAVASGSVSQLVNLPMGVTDIDVVVMAADGITTQTYTVTVTRSEIPTTLTLAQSAEISRFGDAVTFTAVLSGATNPNGAVIFAFGDTERSVALSGNQASLEISDLAVGSHPIAARYEGDSNGNADSIATSITHTVEALNLPVAQNHTLEVMAGTSVSLDLTQGARGGPFTGSAIVSHPASEAGEARIEREGGAHMLYFAATGTFTGATSLTYTLSNADGTSEPATVTIAVIARPDPSLDPEVIGLIRAQTETAQRFANTQITNFNQRLEQLHNEGERRDNSIGVNLAVQQPIDNANAYAPHEGMPHEPAIDAIGQAAPAGASHAGSEPQPVPVEDLFGDLAFWSGGYINFGTNDDGAINLDHTLVGVSGGLDYRFTPHLTAGLGIGYGRDVTDVGANGTESRAEAFSAALYGSYRPVPGVFIDGLAGYSAMSFDSLRFVTATGEFASGSRNGDQLFASLTAGYQYRNDGLLISPYGRLAGSHSTLDAFTETGAGMWNLAYGEQTIDTLSGTLGLRFAYDIETGWGTLTPRGRIEYTHDFEGSSRASLGYADLGTMPYTLDVDGFSRDHISLGLGLDAQIGEGWSLGLDYSTAFGTNGNSQEHTFSAKLGVRF